MSQWTHTQIVDVLIEERLAAGAFPRRGDWRISSDSHPCSETVVKRFGTWAAALDAADRVAPIEQGVVVDPVVVEFALASLLAKEASRMWPIAFRFGFAPPRGKLEISRSSLERFLWADLPRATNLGVADKVRTVAALSRFLRVLPESPKAVTFAEICESPKTARAVIRGEDGGDGSSGPRPLASVAARTRCS